jgi:hypothetical protein
VNKQGRKLFYLQGLPSYRILGSSCQEQYRRKLYPHSFSKNPWLSDYADKVGSRKSEGMFTKSTVMVLSDSNTQKDK